MGGGVNVVESLKSPYVPPIMMVPEPQQYYAEESTVQSEFSGHHDMTGRFYDGPNETEVIFVVFILYSGSFHSFYIVIQSLMAIEFKYMR